MAQHGKTPKHNEKRKMRTSNRREGAQKGDKHMNGCTYSEKHAPFWEDMANQTAENDRRGARGSVRFEFAAQGATTSPILTCLRVSRVLDVVYVVLGCTV